MGGRDMAIEAATKAAADHASKTLEKMVADYAKEKQLELKNTALEDAKKSTEPETVQLQAVADAQAEVQAQNMADEAAPKQAQQEADSKAKKDAETKATHLAEEQAHAQAL